MHRTLEEANQYIAYQQVEIEKKGEDQIAVELGFNRPETELEDQLNS
jgi:hypothetical protein